MVNIRGLILSASLALSAQLAAAATMDCEMNNFSGAKKDIVVSWVGTKFVIDTKTNKAQMGNDKGWFKPLDITKVQKTDKFTAYIAYKLLPDAKGKHHNVRYSFRVYENGKGQVHMSQHQYRPLIGKGTCS